MNFISFQFVRCQLREETRELILATNNCFREGESPAELIMNPVRQEAHPADHSKEPL
jgi:hypothetical protein